MAVKKFKPGDRVRFVDSRMGPWWYGYEGVVTGPHPHFPDDVAWIVDDSFDNGSYTRERISGVNQLELIDAQPVDQTEDDPHRGMIRRHDGTWGWF